MWPRRGRRSCSSATPCWGAYHQGVVTLLADLRAYLSGQDPFLSPPETDGGLTVYPRASGPIIGDPAISATEGVAWNGIIASVGDSDGDDATSQGQYETINVNVDWGDGSNTTTESIVMGEGGYPTQVSAGHVWMETGTYTVTITVSDGDGGYSQTTETANVADGQLNWVGGSNAPNMPPTWSQTFASPPSITTPANQTNTEGGTANLQVQASDPGGYPLSYSALNLPPGLSINSSTGVISGTVAYGAAADFGGSYNPTVLANDGNGGQSQTSFAWTINQAQVAPVLTNPGNQTNLRGDSVSLQPSASQVDNDPITYDAGNLPTGLSIDPDTGLISGTVDPSATLNTPSAVTVTATDDATGLSTSQTFNWTINATNVAPVFTNPGNQTNSAGDDVSLQLSATDVDSDALTYTATGLPQGLSLDPINGVISGALPDSAASNNPYDVTATASDGMTSSSQSFTWTVNAVSLANPDDQSNLDGDNVSLQLYASDANNASLTYSASSLPPGLSINSSTGLISGAISSTADASSPYAVTVTATDGNNNSVSQSFNWTVARLALNPVDDQENQEGTTVSLQLSTADNEGAPTYSATGLPPGLSISSSGLVSGSAGIGSFGSSPYQVTVTATDGSAASSQSFVWTVTPRVALVNPGPQSNAQGDTVSLPLSATSPGGTMSYNASGLPSGLSINSSSGLISGTIASGDSSNSPYTVTISANDGASSSSQTFTWNIAVINLASPGDQNNNDGDTVSLPLTTGYHGGGTLSYSASGLPTGLSINSSTGQISGTISGTADTNSPYSVTVTATDGTNTSSQTFNWTVNSVVSVDPIDDQNNAAGDSVSLQASASDANNSTLTYSATGLPSGLTINSTTGLISGTIAAGDDAHSPYAATVTATDSAGLSASQSFNWYVSHVALADPGPQTSINGAQVQLQLQGSDADGDTVTYTATGLPSGLSISSSGLISGIIASNADTNSPYTVTVTASDGHGNNTQQSFSWTVSQVALTAPSDQTNSEGDTVSLQLQGAASTGTLAYNANGLPAGLSLNTTTGLISGTLAAGDAANGPYTVDVSASNGADSTSQSFSWTVNSVVNLTAPTDQSNVEGNSASLQLTATDSKNATLSYTASGLPAGLSINNSSGLISGTISSGDSANGPYIVTVTASDGTYSSSASFMWTVTHTDTTALTLTNPGKQVNVAGDSVNLPTSASDPDGIDTLTYSVTGLPDGLTIDPSTGIISGTVADDAVTPTPYSVTVTADDGNGQTASQTFTMIANAPTLTATGSPFNAVEGNDSGSVMEASFTTPDLNSQAGDFTASINYGDGTTDTASVSGSNGSFTVTGDHTYAAVGNYPVSVLLTNDVTGASTTISTTATVADAAMTLEGGLRLGDPLTYQAGTFELGVLTIANPNPSLGNYSVNVNWGDGVSSLGRLVSAGCGEYMVEGEHGYPNLYPDIDLQEYGVTVTVQDAAGASASTSDTVVVGQISSQVLGKMAPWLFQDQNVYAPASDFLGENQRPATAEINYGDNIETFKGNVATGPGNGSGGYTYYSITPDLPHGYAQDSVSIGKYQIQESFDDDDGNSLTGKQYTSVTRPPLTGSADWIEAQTDQTLTNVQVAAFSVPDGYDLPGEFSATIVWDDGTTSSGTIVGGGGLFQVLGSHTFTTGGGSDVEVYIYQNWSDGSYLAAILLPADNSGQITGLNMNMPGGPFVLVNANDDNGSKILGTDGAKHNPVTNGIPDTRDLQVNSSTSYSDKELLPVNINITGGRGILPPGMIVLNVIEGDKGGQVRLWSDQKKTRAISPAAYSVSAFESLIGFIPALGIGTIYVEGTQESAALKDVQIELSYYPTCSPGANEKPTLTQTLKLTVTPMVASFTLNAGGKKGITSKTQDQMKKDPKLSDLLEKFPGTFGILRSTAIFNARVITNGTGIVSGNISKQNVFFLQDYLSAKGTATYAKGVLQGGATQVALQFAKAGNNKEPRIKGLPIVPLPWLDWAPGLGANPMPTPFYGGSYQTATRGNVTTISALDQPFLILPSIPVAPLKVNATYSFVTYVVYKYPDGSILTLAKIPWTVLYTKVGGGGETPSLKGTLTSENPQTILATVPNPSGSEAVAINNAIANYQYLARLFWE